jgi:hypothetical protein
MMTRENETPDASEIPAWVPDSVKDAARYLPASDIVERLLSDPRMENVWERLSKQKPDDDAVNLRLLFDDHLPATWDAAERKFSPQQRAAVAFFCAVVEYLTGETKIVKRADVDARAKVLFRCRKNLSRRTDCRRRRASTWL